MIKLLDKYIFKQVLAASIVCLLLFIVVWIAPETLFKVIQRTLEGIYTPQVGMQLLVCEIPKILSKELSNKENIVTESMEVMQGKLILNVLNESKTSRIKSPLISRFPAVSRDISLLLNFYNLLFIKE